MRGFHSFVLLYENSEEVRCYFVGLCFGVWLHRLFSTVSGDSPLFFLLLWDRTEQETDSVQTELREVKRRVQEIEKYLRANRHRWQSQRFESDEQ